MSFTPEIIISNAGTLALVTLAFAAVRRLDRKNRKIDQAREYGKRLTDRLKDELTGLARETEREIKDYGVTLKVSVDAAKTLKTSVDDALSRLKGEAADIDGIRAALAGYGGLLKELSGMTDRVEENLLRIQEESLFVDETAGKIAGAKSRIERLERDIDGMNARVEENVAGAVERASASIERNAKALLEPVRYSVDELRSDAEKAARTVAESRAALEKDLREQTGALRKAEEERARAAAQDMRAIRELLDEAAEKAGERALSLENDVYQKLVRESGARARGLQKAVEAAVDGARAEAEAKVDDVTGYIRTAAEALRGEAGASLAELSARLAADAEAARAAGEARVADMAKRAREAAEDLRAQAEGLRARADEEARGWERDMETIRAALDAETEKWDALRARLDGGARELGAEAARAMDGVSGEVREAAESARAELEDARASFSRSLDELRSSCAAAAGEVGADIAAHRKAAREELESLAGSLAAHAEEAKERALRAADERLEEFRLEQENRCRGLSEAADDARRLEEELRLSFENVTRRVHDECARFEEDAKARRDGLARDWDAGLDALKARLSSLGMELDGIKERAARNVSEKAALFEASFESGLERRGERIDGLFEDWMAGAADKLAALQKEAEGAYRLAEQSAADAWKKRLAETEAGILAELGRLKDETAAFENGIRDEMRLADGSLDRFREQLEGGLKELRGGAEHELKTLIARHTLENDAALKTYRGDQESALKLLSAQVEEKARGIAETIEAARKEAGEAGDDIRRRTEEARAEYEQKMKDEEERVTERIERFNREIERALGEREAACGERLDAAGAAVEALRADIEAGAARGGERLARLTADVEKIAAAAAAYRDEILAHTEARAKTLDEAVHAARSRIEDFYAQSKLIDRSMEMKEELVKAMDDIKNDMARLDDWRAEAGRLETQLAKVKRLGDDVDAKMRHFMTEQGRVDLMETNFKRLLAASRSVEERLGEVTGSGDMLQDMQIKIRQIGDSLDGVEEKYARLEKKKLTLDATTERVDTNFKALEEAEKKTLAAREEAARCVAELGALKEAVAALGADQKKALEAAEKTGALDAELSHIEERIAQMRTARQWLADLETRIDQKHREMRTGLNAIAPPRRDAKRGGDSASLETQEQVRTLRRQGWKEAEIAASLQLSIGEVQLILELPPRD